MQTATHEKYMQRCLELAKKGQGNVSTNPMVGSVIVHKGKIIGEGYHRKYGEAHAEVNAINSVKNKELLKESTIYVNLEPCAHHGKTPPCSDLIVSKKIPHVVIACIDSFSEVAGKGIEKMRKAGCKVEVGILEEESRDLNRRFFTFHEKKRPYIILKWAQTLDGFVDIDRKLETPDRPTWITNELSRTIVHKWRGEEDAIMVGTNTAFADNPKLNIRDWAGENPVRIVLNQDFRLPMDLSVFDDTVRTLVFVSNENLAERKQALAEKKQTELIPISFMGSVEDQVLDELYRRSIQSVIVEGGAMLLASFIQKGLWDEARVFIGETYFKAGVKAPEINGNIISIDELWCSKLLVYRNVIDN